MLVVGTGKEARRFADRVERHRELGIRVIGHLATHGTPLKAGSRPVLGSMDDIETVLHDRVVDEVAVCLPSDDLHWVEPVARLCEEVGKIVRIPLDTVPVSLPGGRVEDFDGGKVLSLAYGPDRVLGLVAKRLIDVFLAGAALILLSPVFAIIGLTVMLVDGRPVIFRQERVGLHGRPFDVVKFRTMVPDAEALLTELEEQNEIKGHAFKITDDPRLTRTGRILRATSLDELPQVWNVLLGEMSLVGPRPPLPREVAGYDLWHRRRLSMKPGITGLWQVAARRDDDFDRWVALDLAYIDRWSIMLDLKIIAKTIPAMLQGR
jgi:exopolysaccharide biosynthesis polyprenyl glycosylphosphotransferase